VSNSNSCGKEEEKVQNTPHTKSKINEVQCTGTKFLFHGYGHIITKVYVFGEYPEKHFHLF
jgi:hypothetical protein